jgi:hypothetical protein
MKKHLLFLTALSCLGWAGAALAGPNAGGTLIVHANPSLVYTDSHDFCGEQNLDICANAITSLTGTDTQVWYAIAAFPDGSSPRLAGITFGINYDVDQMHLMDQAGCGDFELPTSNWPAPGSGNAVTFNSAQTNLLDPVYWFAGYSYGYGANEFALTPHPTQGGDFADDEIPSILDPIVDFGRLGFDSPGYLPCPAPMVLTGACCFADGSCLVLSADDCSGQGGNYQGDNTTCNPNPCPQPTGACCFGDGSCQVLTAADCGGQGGSYQGDNSSCNPNPCPQPTGACCAPDGSCTVTTGADCADNYLGDGTVCAPNPCP